MIQFEPMHPRATEDHLGIIPEWFNEDDPASAREQINQHYQHGGGWHPLAGFKMAPNEDLLYPGDPPTRALWKAKLRDETIIIYEYAWVAIIQPDGSFEVARCD